MFHFIGGALIIIGMVFIITGVAGHKPYRNDALTLLWQGMFITFLGLLIGTQL